MIGNHLAQHPELSLVAIALAVHIQSLPSNTLVDIKTLATRFPEGRTRIAAGLRELEAHGYLRRERERTPSGRVITRTVSCNQPGASREHAPTRTTPWEPKPRDAPDATTGTEPRRKRTPHPLPPVPRPPCHSPAMLETATEFLCGLRRHDPRLVFSACDTAHLAPGVVAWMQYDVPLSAVRTALTADLPPEHDLRRPAALLAHRLTALLPPPPPVRAPSGPKPLRTTCRTATAATAPSAPPNRACAATAVRRPPLTRKTGTPCSRPSTPAAPHDYSGQCIPGRTP